MRSWDRAKIIAAIRRWADEHGGVPPTAILWNPQHAIAVGRRDEAMEFYRGDWPYLRTVQQLFGKWSWALEAAGYEAFRPGHSGREGEDPAVCIDTFERVRDGESYAAVARDYGVSGGTATSRAARGKVYR